MRGNVRQPGTGERDPCVGRDGDTNDSDGDFLDETRRFWQSRTSRRLSREDAREISSNITGFFQVLLEWDAAELPSACSPNQDTANAPCEQNGSVQAGQRIAQRELPNAKRSTS